MNRTRAPPRQVNVHRTPPRAPCLSVSRAAGRTALPPITRSLIMSKVKFTSLMALCTALAACAERDTNRTVTAPDAGPAFSEAAADIGISYTLDGPSDVGSASEDASAQLAGAQLLGAQLAASPQAASGSRASGHVGFPSG